ncbi:glycosyltransferase family 2 protein [Paraburkholderia aspalathi]|uniref:glycosyltransferase family 2 protein n=1 Tax=Paraburkholderia aspalathi TaxID=1324617 RepID=UPI0038BC75BB
MKSIDILIVNWNGKNFLEKLLPQLFNLEDFNSFVSKLIVVDNASEDGSVNYILNNFPRVELISLDHNCGYAKGNNIGLRRCAAQYVFLLNNDLEIRDPAILRKLVTLAQATDSFGAIAPALYLPRGQLQTGAGGFDRGLLSFFSYFLFVGRVFPVFSRPFYIDQGRLVRRAESVALDWVSGAAMMVNSSALKEIGGIPEDYFMYSEDVKLCRNIRAKGLRVIYSPSTSIFHIHGGSENKGGVKTRWIESTLSEYGSRCGPVRIGMAKLTFASGFMLRGAAYFLMALFARGQQDKLAARRMFHYFRAAMNFAPDRNKK